MTGGIIPQCSTCNDLGRDPNGCPKCNTLGPAGRKAAKDSAARGARAKANQPKAASAGGTAKAAQNKEAKKARTKAIRAANREANKRK